LCNNWDNSLVLDLLDYRGEEYYRANVPCMVFYSHTMTPNFVNYDCTDSTFTAAHMAARSWHPGGVNVVFCDGSVHFIKNTISPKTWAALGTISGGEVISADAF
jgi:prepilin-type processing-associated H-X9-DG protein